jgi:hypothetical protein
MAEDVMHAVLPVYTYNNHEEHSIIKAERNRRHRASFTYSKDPNDDSR